MSLSDNKRDLSCQKNLSKKAVQQENSALSIWKSNTIVYIKGSCGTGCSQSVIFMAPSTNIVCPIHEYRIENLNPDEPPDFYNNDPLIIEPHKKMYVCYAEDNVIVFQMPRKLRMTIHPLKGYYADEASIRHHHLVITYRNRHGKVKKIIYKRKPPGSGIGTFYNSSQVSPI